MPLRSRHRAAGRVWDVSALKGRCRALRDALRPLVDAETLASYWPGGAENAEIGRGGWIECYAQYVRLADGGELRAERAQRTDDRTERRLDAARLNAPEAVACADGATRYVYAKSYDALRALDALDGKLRAVLADVGQYADDVAVYAVGALLESRLVRTWAWIITHPAAGLPFTEADEGTLPPAWTEALCADDLLALWRANQTVNGRDLQLIAALFPPSKDAKAPRFTLGSFLGSTADDWHVQVEHLARDWPLRTLFVQRVDAARAAESARESAERTARTPREAR